MKMKMCVKKWWNDTDREKAEYYWSSLIPGQFLGYMFHVE
jgi:hypothetical protein